MRILLLSHSFNSLTQRLYVELRDAGHEVSVEFDINDAVSEEAVALFNPDVVIAPFLKRALPESIWRKHLTWIVHPGIRGDRGPAALDWAILDGEQEWGVTILQANAEMDAGDIWAEVRFPMREARKSSLYRFEVTEAALRGVFEALAKLATRDFRPLPLDRASAPGRQRPAMPQSVRAIDWQRDDSATVLRRIRASDGAPGVLDELFGRSFYLFDAHAEAALRGEPGRIIAKRDGAILRATRDGAVWIGHVRVGQTKVGQETAARAPPLKLPAAVALAGLLDDVPEIASAPHQESAPAWREIAYRESGAVGYLTFDFLNGAMSTEQCERLREALRRAKQSPVRVIVLLGGEDFWSNGIHLHRIEAAANSADESWRNINAMDDLTREILLTDGKLTIAAMRGNAGAGGVFLALAADQVFAAQGVVLNPHYKSMGNLFGSEYWTYLLPRRVGAQRASEILQARLPLGARGAAAIGLIDAMFGTDRNEFLRHAEARAQALAESPDFAARIEAKRAARARDEAEKPLERYREEELERMRLNFYGFDPSYHVARYNFVHRVPYSRTPLHLAAHRRRRTATQGVHLRAAGAG